MGQREGSTGGQPAEVGGILPAGSVVRDADHSRDRIASLVVDPPVAADAEVLLLLHDIDANAFVWTPIVRRLVSEGRLALAPDLRGRGSSFGLGAGRAVALPDHWEDVALLLEEFGVDRVLVVGHGWGSEVARNLAEHMPEMVCAMVAIDPSIWRMAPERLTSSPLDRDALRQFWVDELTPSGCLEADALMLADHDSQGAARPVTIRVDLDVLRRDSQPAVGGDGSSAWRGPVEIVRSAHDLADGRPVARSHDVPLLDHTGVIMSPNGADVVLAAIDRADRTLARLERGA